MTSHLPNHKEQMVRYYGFNGNFSRGLRQIENQDALLPFPYGNTLQAASSGRGADCIVQTVIIRFLFIPYSTFVDTR